MDKIVRFFAVIVCLCLVAGMVPVAFAQGNRMVVTISSVEAFLNFAENCRIDSYSAGKIFRLQTDLDLTDVDFSGIPIFCGIFDGNGHTITGLNIRAEGSVIGLFRYVQPSATVKNLNIQAEVSPGGTRSNVGGIAGINAGIIQNCSFQGIITGLDDIGGIAGTNEEGGRILQCRAEGVIAGKHSVGGIVGKNSGNLENCTNEAMVNTTAQQNQVDISDITLENLIGTELAMAATDIGGIAGYSDGNIRHCVNYGNVGYQHMGYNIGGIVGIQSGYVFACTNYGRITGRKEVGGIVGQQVPFLMIHYATDSLQILKQEFAVLSQQMKAMSADLKESTAEVRSLMVRLDDYLSDLEDALDILQSVAENPRLEDLGKITDALETVRKCIRGMDSTMRSLIAALDETATTLESDFVAIEKQMLVLENALDNAQDNVGGAFHDASDEDTPEDLQSKVEKCCNYADIYGDLNAGGIVGSVAVENDLDPEDDVSIDGDATFNVVGNVRSVIVGCENAGNITAKTMRAGGIVGYLSMGLVKSCRNKGTLDNGAADYVGGIAGDSAGFIRDCRVKCSIVGDMYVGGIAGEGSVASNNYAMVTVSGREKYGAIFGTAGEPYSDVENPVMGNFYLKMQTDIGAIDGISYEAAAQALALQKFLALENSDDFFEYVTVTFLAGDEIVASFTQKTGAAFTTIPDVPENDGKSGAWEGIAEADLQYVLFDLTFHARYTGNDAVIGSDLQDKNGRPILLLQGDFPDGTHLTVTDDAPFNQLSDGETLLGAWDFTTGTIVDLNTGRLLLPSDTESGNLEVFVRNSEGNWEKRSFHQDGSYIVMSIHTGDSAIALVENEIIFWQTGTFWLILGAAFTLLLSGVLLWMHVRRKKRKRMSHASQT